MRAGGGASGNDRGGDDLIAGAADGGDSGCQIEGEDLVTRHMGIIENMDDMDVSIDQAGEEELSPSIDPDGRGWDFSNFGTWGNGGNFVALSENGVVRQKLA